MLKLSIQDSEGRSTLVPLTGGELSIGRDKSNVICLTDRNVSRHHARLVIHEDRVVLENTQATYGTRLNNLLVRASSEIRSGDVIEVGDYKLEIVSDAPKDTAQRDGSGAMSGAADATGKSRAVEGATSVVNVGALQNNLDEADRATALPESQQPRLVVESENLRGLELRVERTPTVLGRVAESADLIVDHRSISKEHARLTRQSDGSWQVLDLGSANGMRVNGEAYSKCALSHGDRLELGHVVLRFEAPGSMAGAVQSANGGLLTNKPLLIGVAVLAVLAIAALIALLRGSDPAPAAAEGVGSSTPPAAEGEAAPVAADPAEAAAAPAEAPPAAETLESALAKVDALYKAGLLTEAKDAAAAVVAQFPGKAQAEARSRLVEIALDVQKTLDRAREQLPVAPAEAIALATAAQGRMDDDSPKSLRDAAAQIIADANAALEAARLAAPVGAKPAMPAKPKASGDTPPSTGAVRPVTPTPPAAVTKPEPPKPVVAEPTAKPVEPVAKSEEKPEERPAVSEPTTEPVRKTGQMLYKEARDKVLAGDEEGGLTLYKQALAAGYAKSHGQLAKLYFGKGDKAGCARHAKAYLERYPDAGDAPQMQTLLEKCQ